MRWHGYEALGVGRVWGPWQVSKERNREVVNEAVLIFFHKPSAYTSTQALSGASLVVRWFPLSPDHKFRGSGGPLSMVREMGRRECTGQ